MKIILIDEDGKKSKKYDAAISKDDIPDEDTIEGFVPIEKIIEIKVKGKLDENER